MFFVVCRDGPEFRLLAAGGNHELIEVKKLRAPFALSAALLAISQKLVDGFGYRFFDFRRFAFDNDNRQAVQEEDDVGYDVMLGAANPDLELANCDKPVVVAMLEV